MVDVNTGIEESLLCGDDSKIDWNFTPEKDKRKWGRLTSRYIKKFYFNSSLEVYFHTRNLYYSGLVLDISAGGMLVSLTQLIETDPSKISFMVGKNKVITLASIQRKKVVDNGYEYGLMFIDIKSGDQELLNDLYVNKILQFGR